MLLAETLAILMVVAVVAAALVAPLAVALRGALFDPLERSFGCRLVPRCG